MKVVDRVEKIKPFFVMEFLELAKAKERAGIDIVHMEVGEPDFPPPEIVREKTEEALKENYSKYTPSLGLDKLREIVSSYYLEEGVEISPERIVITSGTTGAFLLLFFCLLDQEKTLSFSDPGYPCYKNIAILCGSKVQPVVVNEESNYMIRTADLEALEISPDVLIVSSPSNPTGTVYDEKTLEDLYQYMKERGGTLIVDEIYRGLTYDKEPETALKISDEIIVVDGLSKAYAMTGYRIGWMVVPKGLVKYIQKCSQNAFICPPSVSQFIALYAFSARGETEMMREEFRRRRDYLIPELRSMGFSIPVIPQGAFYVYAGIKKWGMDSMEFCKRALEEAHVALTPGYDFGEYRANEHVRFSFATSLERLKEGVSRLKGWLRTINPDP